MLKINQRMMYVAGSYRPQLQKTFLLSITASIFQGIIFALFYPLLLALTSRPIELQQIGLLLALFGSLVIVEGWLRWRELDFGWLTSLDVAHETRLRLGEQLRRIPLQVLNQRQSGDLNVVMSGNVSELVMWIGSLATLVIQTVVVPSVVVLFTVIIDWRLAVALLIFFPLAVPIYRQMRSRSQTSLRKMVNANADAASRMVEYAQGLPVLRANNQVGKRSQRLQAALEWQRTVQQQGQRLASLPTITMATLVEIGILAIIGLGVLFILQGTLSTPALLALIIIAMRFTEPVTQLVSLTSVFDLMEVGLERIETIMAIPALPAPSSPAVLTHFDIHFDQVYFRYDDQTQWALQEVSFKAPARSLTALVGPSGSGKTTISRLISRYADVHAGAIRIGDVNIQEVDPAHLMHAISVVFQDVYLLDDTILNNIRMAKPDATDTEVEAVARTANCHDFIARLPQGYNTRIGDIGGALSGGERQRLSIARAMLKNAPIVLLDEPTSALDTESEVAVQDAINQLVVDKTVIVIAHRLSTIAAADLILFLEDGKVIERGSHRELLASQGRYATMWEIQQRAQDWRVVA
ncbi:MAG: ABC transporter ATP-binding protein [Cyanophyceae cyanobacterium]